MGRYWAKIAQISDFAGKLQLGFIMQIWGVRGSRCAGCGAERRQWRMQRGGAPAAVEKIEQASSAKIFSGTARRQGLRLAEEDEKPGSQGESVGLRLAEALGE